MNKPYRIRGLLGVDTYPTHPAAAVIWTLSSVSPSSTWIVDLTFVICKAFWFREDPRTTASAG